MARLWGRWAGTSRKSIPYTPRPPRACIPPPRPAEEPRIPISSRVVRWMTIAVVLPPCLAVITVCAIVCRVAEKSEES